MDEVKVFFAIIALHFIMLPFYFVAVIFSLGDINSGHEPSLAFPVIIATGFAAAGAFMVWSFLSIAKHTEARKGLQLAFMLIAGYTVISVSEYFLVQEIWHHSLFVTPHALAFLHLFFGGSATVYSKVFAVAYTALIPLAIIGFALRDYLEGDDAPQRC